MQFKIFCVLSLCVIAWSAPTDPLWPNQFTQTFTEQMNNLGLKYKTSGTYYYDYLNNQYRIDRDNGKGDRYCGTSIFQNIPCNHYVSNGDRYLHYPSKDICCYCCSSADGCGILKPTWLSGAQFLGETTYNG